MSFSTERALSLTRGDSTDNLLMDLSPPEVVAPCSSNSLTPTMGSASPSNQKSATARVQKQTRPMLTAPSFEQHPPDLRDSPWSSTETSGRSRKNSGCLDFGTTNNNTLGISVSNSISRGGPQSQSSVESNSNRNRSVPDIELHYRRGSSDDRLCIISSESPRLYNRHITPHFPHHHHHNLIASRPRVCEHQPFSFSLSRATSRESVRSVQPSSANDSLQLPTVLTTLHRENRMLRQHSQPETSCYHCQVGNNASASLRQLKEATTGDAIAGIAADTLRINGAFRQFRQVVFPVRHLLKTFVV